MVCYAEQVVANYGVMLRQWCEPWCVTLNRVVVNHGELCFCSGCESWCAMKSQWLCIMSSYDEQVIVNHGVLC